MQTATSPKLTVGVRVAGAGRRAPDVACPHLGLLSRPCDQEGVHGLHEEHAPLERRGGAVSSNGRLDTGIGWEIPLYVSLNGKVYALACEYPLYSMSLVCW